MPKVSVRKSGKVKSLLKDYKDEFKYLELINLWTQMADMADLAQDSGKDTPTADALSYCSNMLIRLKAAKETTKNSAQKTEIHKALKELKVEVTDLQSALLKHQKARALNNSGSVKDFEDREKALEADFLDAARQFSNCHEEAKKVAPGQLDVAKLYRETKDLIDETLKALQSCGQGYKTLDADVDVFDDEIDDKKILRVAGFIRSKAGKRIKLCADMQSKLEALRKGLVKGFKSIELGEADFLKVVEDMNAQLERISADLKKFEEASVYSMEKMDELIKQINKEFPKKVVKANAPAKARAEDINSDIARDSSYMERKLLDGMAGLNKAIEKAQKKLKSLEARKASDVNEKSEAGKKFAIAKMTTIRLSGRVMELKASALTCVRKKNDVENLFKDRTEALF